MSVKGLKLVSEAMKGGKVVVTVDRWSIMCKATSYGGAAATDARATTSGVRNSWFDEASKHQHRHERGTDCTRALRQTESS